MRRTVCLGALSLFLLSAPATAVAAERMRVADPAEALAEADLTEVRITSDAGAMTVVLRFGSALLDHGPTVEVQLGLTPQGSGNACEPRPSGPTTIRLKATSGPQRAVARSTGVVARPIVWAGVDRRELVVHVSGRAIGSGAIGCIAARSLGDPEDQLGPAVPQLGTWPLLADPSEDRFSGRLAVALDAADRPARIRFQTGLYRGASTAWSPTGPARTFAGSFQDTVVDRGVRLPERELAWRALASNAGGTGYSAPRVVRFEDIEAPTIRLRPASAKGGTRLQVRGDLADDSGRAFVILEVRDGPRVIGRHTGALRPVPARAGAVLGRFPTPARAARLVVCGVAVDAAGNRSVRSCVDVVLRAPGAG